MPFLFIYLFIQTYLYRVKTLLAFSYFAYVPCFMTSICIKSENTYLNNNYHIMYNSYNNENRRYIRHFRLYSDDICLCVNWIGLQMYIQVKRKENTNVPTLKLQQKPTKIGESDKTCTVIAALDMIE